MMGRMMKYEIYVRDERGVLIPTGLWERGYKLNQVEAELNRKIAKIGKPCTILTSLL